MDSKKRMINESYRLVEVAKRKSNESLEYSDDYQINSLKVMLKELDRKLRNPKLDKKDIESHIRLKAEIEDLVNTLEQLENNLNNDIL